MAIQTPGWCVNCAQAAQRLGEYMLLSCYACDSGFESPQHSSEYQLDSTIHGHVA